MSEPKKYRIYVLMDSSGSVRYVGITTKTLQERLTGHYKIAKRKRTHRDNWIRSLKYDVRIMEIESTDDFRREQFWISHYRNQGCNLTNATEGGEGITGYRHTQQSKDKMSQARKGVPKPEQSRANYAAAAKKRWSCQETRKELSERLMGHEVSFETRQKIGQSRIRLVESGWIHPCTGRKHSEERRRKNSEAQLKRAAMGFPGNRKGVKASEETRAKLRAALQRRKDRGEPLVFKSKSKV